MALKFVLLSCLMMGLANASYIHGPSSMSSNNYGTSTAQYVSQSEIRYPSNTGSSNSQGSNSQSTESVVGNQGNGQSLQQVNSSQHKTGQINSAHYSLTNQGKSDVRVTNPGTYSSNNYNSAAGDHRGHQEQQLSYAVSTPSYSNNNNNNNNDGYQHSVLSSSAYQQQPTPVYGHINNPAGAVYTHHHSVPVYQYVSSAYALPTGSSNYAVHNGNAYSHQGSPASSSSSSPSSVAHIIGVPYSPAVAVSHMSYSSPIGISYGW